MLQKLHFLTANTQGLGDKQKRERFYTWAKYQKGNIILAQETHFTATNAPFVQSEWNGEVLHNFGTSQSCGVAIFLTKNLEYEIIDVHRDNDGRLLLVNLKINDNVYTIINIYAPNDKNRRNIFFKNLKTFTQEHSLGLIIIGGDWNEIQDTKSDRKSRVNPQKPVKSLKSLINECRLIDCWRIKHPTTKQFTWKRKNVNNEASRIDYFLIQNELIHKISSTDIRPVLIKYTDHQAVSLYLNVEKTIRGPGYLKLNNSLLNDYMYI